MKGLKIGGKVETINLNNHIVSVITPKKSVSYEEGVKRIDKLISKIKKRNNQ